MPKVSILLATYLETAQPYLNLALQSINNQSFKDFEIIVVSSGAYRPQIPEAPNLKHFHSESRLHFPPAIKTAFELSDQNSDFILIANDDIIMDRDCLASMIDNAEYFRGANGMELVQNPMSNCDNGWFFQAECGFQKEEGHKVIFSNRQYKLDKLPAEFIPGIMNRSLIHPNRTLVFPHFVAFYCTLMRRETWHKVGGIDPNFKTGSDDLDFCMRAQQIGIRPAISLNAACFHFSGISADQVLTVEERDYNQKYLEEKWSKNAIKR